jgi:hypothetical protein
MSILQKKKNHFSIYVLLRQLNGFRHTEGACTVKIFVWQAWIGYK